jgi:predicted permease
MTVLDAIGHALATAGSMTWQITWSLILGFTLSAVVQAVVPRETVARMLGDDKSRALARATGLGAASSSCSYAAAALARALFRRRVDFTAAMAFEGASTNLAIGAMRKGRRCQPCLRRRRTAISAADLVSYRQTGARNTIRRSVLYPWGYIRQARKWERA